MILPGMYEIIEGKVTINQIREVDVEDLLHRDSVCLDIEDIANYVTMKRVLVTGAGGSIGSELCRQIARFYPKELILLGHDENPIFNIEKELAHEYPGLQLTSIIADIKDRERIRLIFNTAKPEVVFHAAAHKHVPLMEDNPVEAIKNNIFGTLNLAEAADRSGTGIFVLISTDKAVNPSNVMGTTKRVAEMIMQKMSTLSKTRFVAVRFGNVLGSDGSVIEVFKEQIKHGGPVTVTHEEMTRYFMTIPEAAQLVIQAGAMASGGEIFVLDMGNPIRIMDLARDMIRFSGFDEREIPIDITGVRPGEKLHEKLVASDEGVDNTRHERIMVVKPQKLNVKKFEEWLLQMAHFSYAEYNQDMLISLLNAMVPFGDTAYREQAS
jgi:FlaA1/EpsC-like NDP-sugar epimerase